jgi:hypothetical protein
VDCKKTIGDVYIGSDEHAIGMLTTFLTELAKELATAAVLGAKNSATAIRGLLPTSIDRINTI